MVLMIDNYDSFTYNIVQYCQELGADLKVIRNDEMSVAQIKRLGAKKIILSPGPSTPNEAGVTLEVIKELGGEVPLFGICLGHQSIAQAHGAKIVRAGKMMHGKTSLVEVVDKTALFDNLPKEFTQTRYHSLVVSQENLPEIITPTSYSKDDHEIMSLEIKDKAIYGVQFHPESIMSQFGHEIIGNFLNL